MINGMRWIADTWSRCEFGWLICNSSRVVHSAIRIGRLILFRTVFLTKPRQIAKLIRTLLQSFHNLIKALIAIKKEREISEKRHESDLLQGNQQKTNWDVQKPLRIGSLGSGFGLPYHGHRHLSRTFRMLEHERVRDGLRHSVSTCPNSNTLAIRHSLN